MIKFCSLFSGSSGNSLFLSVDGDERNSSSRTKILIDAGMSAKRIIQALESIGENPMDLSAILVSHEHSDHRHGVGIMSRKFNVPIYANENTWSAMEKEIGPVNIKNKQYFITGDDFEINDVCIRPFGIPHDAAEPVGFNFFSGNRKITTATDLGHINKALLSYFEESDLILLESNHDLEMLRIGPYPWPLKKRIEGENGHLSNEMAGKVVAYLAERGTRRFLLGHLSKENNFPELAYQTVLNALTEKKMAVGSEISLAVATRDRVGEIIEI